MRNLAFGGAYGRLFDDPVGCGGGISLGTSNCSQGASNDGRIMHIDAQINAQHASQKNRQGFGSVSRTIIGDVDYKKSSNGLGEMMRTSDRPKTELSAFMPGQNAVSMLTQRHIPMTTKGM